VAFAAFLISAILLGATCVAVARLAQAWADRFWLLIAAFLLQLGFITSILSPLYALTGRNWLRVQAIVLLPIAVVIYIWRPRRAGVTASRPASASSRSKTFLLAILLIAAMIAISGVEKFLLPVSNIDDRNYYASRAAYWIQNQSALHYSTHNDRQVMFPISAQLPFFWPLLFTRAEAPAQFVYWLAYPLLALAMYALLREMNQSSTVAAVGAMLLCLTPQVVLTTRGAHNEHWVTLCTLGCAFWCVRAWRNQGTAPLDFILAALFATLAAAQRITAIPLLPAVLLLPFLVGASRGKLRALATMSLTIVIAIACSGWLLTIVENTRHFGHPLGPSAIRARHSPDYSKRTIATHLARFVLVLLDPPALPTASLRDAYARGATKVLEASNTAKSLRYETLQDDWPGPYIVRPTPFAEFYSLPGLAILPALCAAIFLAMRDIRATSPHMRLRPVSLLA
jgi:4-amino-4-deoxy-L-arabinose transferase-like glycosyltransferase